MSTIQHSAGPRAFSRKQKLRYACLSIFIGCMVAKFALDHHLRERGVSVDIHSLEAHAPWLLGIGAWLFLYAALLIHAHSPEEWH